VLLLVASDASRGLPRQPCCRWSLVQVKFFAHIEPCQVLLVFFLAVAMHRPMQQLQQQL
jgi:hypothetical protein